MDQCAVCGSHAGLEMHHIIPQKDVASAESSGIHIHSGGNLVCLCAVCHDHHHGGRLIIEGWQDTSDGRKLKISWASTDTSVPDEVRIWIREQKQRKVRAATIRRLVEQTFKAQVTLQQIREI